MRSQAPGRSAHHSGWSEIDFTPRVRKRYDTSCRRGSADDTFRGDPSGSVAPVQKTSADDAARGREISIEKVTFATEILKNGPQNEEIKKAAVECLTKYLMRGL